MRQHSFRYWGEHRVIKRRTDQRFGGIKHFLAPNVEKLKKGLACLEKGISEEKY